MDQKGEYIFDIHGLHYVQVQYYIYNLVNEILFFLKPVKGLIPSLLTVQKNPGGEKGSLCSVQYCKVTGQGYATKNEKINKLQNTIEIEDIWRGSAAEP